MYCVEESPTAIHNGACGEATVLLNEKLISSPCACHDTRDEHPRLLWLQAHTKLYNYDPLITRVFAHHHDFFIVSYVSFKIITNLMAHSG